CKVLSVSVPVNTGGNLKNYKNPGIFLTTELAQKSDKSNNPNIGTYPASISEDGLLSGECGEGYTITSEGVYVGYSFTVSTLDRGTQFPISIADCSNPNACFLHTKATTKAWDNIQATNGWGSTMSVTLLIDRLPERDVEIYEIDNPICIELGKAASIPVTFMASTMEPVESIDLDYAFNGQPLSLHYELPVPTTPGLGRTFSTILELPVADVKIRGKEDFTVSKVNGKENTSENATKNVMISVLDEYPEHQTLMEEYTGTWCQYCTRGFAALEHIRNNYPEFVVAAYHNSDAMQVTTNYPAAIEGFPSASLNRTIICDPYYGTETYKTKLPIVDDILALNSVVTPWSVKVSHTWDDDDTLTANAEVMTLGGYTDKTYQIAYLLVADGLSGTGSSWNQSNYYANTSQRSDYIDEMNDFCKNGKYGKSSVKGLVFNDVVISTTGIYGVEGSLPSSLDPEEPVTHSLTFDLTKIKAGLIADKNKLRIIAAVLDENGTVLNCAKNEVNDYEGTSVRILDAADDENAPVEYYNLNGQKVNEPGEGIFIRRQGSSAVKIAK
ncbi:MAG: hypothetical protein K2K93_11745, partial [Muribaculaceae bacterium]|nr:hypothetical protein [Muribaculaceae bacterium]